MEKEFVKTEMRRIQGTGVDVLEKGSKILEPYVPNSIDPNFVIDETFIDSVQVELIHVLKDKNKADDLREVKDLLIDLQYTRSELKNVLAANGSDGVISYLEEKNPLLTMHMILSLLNKNKYRVGDILTILEKYYIGKVVFDVRLLNKVLSLIEHNRTLNSSIKKKLKNEIFCGVLHEKIFTGIHGDTETLNIILYGLTREEQDIVISGKYRAFLDGVKGDKFTLNMLSRTRTKEEYRLIMKGGMYEDLFDGVLGIEKIDQEMLDYLWSICDASEHAKILSGELYSNVFQDFLEEKGERLKIKRLNHSLEMSNSEAQNDILKFVSSNGIEGNIESLNIFLEGKSKEEQDEILAGNMYPIVFKGILTKENANIRTLNAVLEVRKKEDQESILSGITYDYLFRRLLHPGILNTETLNIVLKGRTQEQKWYILNLLFSVPLGRGRTGIISKNG